MQAERWLIDAVSGSSLVDNSGRRVELDQTRRGHFVVQEAVRVDQVVVEVLVEAHRDVVGDARRPPVQVHDSVEGGELAAQQTLALRVVQRVDAADVVDGYEDTGDAAVRARSLCAGVAVGQQELADLLEGDEAGGVGAVLELVGDDRLELLPEGLAVEYGGDALARLHGAHVLFDVGGTLHLAPVLGIFRVDGFDEFRRRIGRSVDATFNFVESCHFCLYI